MNSFVLLAEAGGGGAAPGGDGAGTSMLTMIVAMGLIFYFLIFRPESKRRKEKEALISALKTKDEVVTIGGMRGTVADIDGDDVVLLVDPKKDVKIRFRRTAIESVIQKEEKK